MCAFALKGEHNVYSLVPNIAVCMYTYIDTKFSYDNNVYFSIFYEHRQLKHGMHVIDPSREVSSHCMTVQVVTSGYKWLQVVTSGYKWLQVVTSGYKWFYVVKSGVMWFYVVKLCYVAKWFYVAKWLYVAKWFYVVMWLSGFMWLK